MGTAPEAVVVTDDAITSAYAGGATTGDLNVGGSDSITLLFDITSGPPTFFAQPVLNGRTAFKVDSEGNAVADEITHIVANASSFSLRFDTRGVDTFELQMRGSSGSGTVSVSILKDGSDNVAHPAAGPGF